jgi:hypothetical protein
MSEWKKTGINPFVCATLRSKKIWHVIIETEDGNADMEADPKTAYLKNLQELNATLCDILDAFGYDGGQLRIELYVCSNKYCHAQHT